MSLDLPAPTRGNYHCVSPWRPWAALLATLLVIAASIAASVGVSGLFQAERTGGAGDYDQVAAWGSMLAFQVVATAAALLLAGLFGGRRWQVLALDLPPAAPWRVLAYFAMLALPSLAYTYLLFWWQPAIVHADMATFAPLVHSRMWPIYALIIAVGAPLSEELLFRGFLQSALAKSRLGFVGATIVSTTAWGLLHIQYSVWGLAEIFVVGFCLSWTLWRTGSLWTPILLHGLYNGAQFTGLMLRLFPWT